MAVTDAATPIVCDFETMSEGNYAAELYCYDISGNFYAVTE